MNILQRERERERNDCFVLGMGVRSGELSRCVACCSKGGAVGWGYERRKHSDEV